MRLIQLILLGQLLKREVQTQTSNSYIRLNRIIILFYSNNRISFRGGKKQSAEQVAHKVAWAAVKKKYEKQGGTWVEK